MDGRWIEKFSFVNVFTNSDGSGAKYRAKVTNLRPDGMSVQYQDSGGNKIASPGPEFPEFIRADEITKRVAAAPRGSGVRLDAVPEKPKTTETDKALDKRPKDEPLADPDGTAAEFLQSKEMQDWKAKVDEFNSGISAAKSQNVPGEKLSPLTTKEWNAMSAPLGDGGVDGVFAKVTAQLDPAFDTHQQFVAKTVAAAGSAGLNIESMFQDAKGNWSPAVQKYADDLVLRLLLRDERDDIPRNRKALVLGGLPGAGKSTIIGNLGLNDERNPTWVSLNPDIIKEHMIADGIFPHVEGLAPMETVGMIHELSSDISKMYSAMAMEEGFNVIHDVTLGTDKAANRIKDANTKFGYEADAVFVDVPVEMSAKSQIKRHLGGLNRLRAGESTEGGRYVPTAVLAGSAPTTKDERSKNAEVFAKFMGDGMFRRWAVVDNNNYVNIPLSVGSGADKLPGDPAALIKAPETMPGIF